MSNDKNNGYEFEKAMVKFLNDYGFKAYRTNKANEADPKCFKAGYDGGVDIIATCEMHHNNDMKSFVFYIQCKNHKDDIGKEAVSAVYAGLHSRKATGANSIPVVIATSDMSQETLLFAKSLDVEVFLKNEYQLIQNTINGYKPPYAQYGIMMKCLLYNVTHDAIWFDTLPNTGVILRDISMAERLMESYNMNFDEAQSHMDKMSMYQRKAMEESQKALDIQKMTVYNALMDLDAILHKQKKEIDNATKEASLESG